MTASPTFLGRYALFGEIAAGGMATVQLGRLLGPVGFSRTVAVKRLHESLAKNPEFVAMMLDEARLAGQIHHPNVISTLDVVTTEDELLLIMEYVHGESLSRLMKSGPIPVGVSASIIAGALHGLHAAHEAKSERGRPLGIVHRDVSPQNILVGTDGLARVGDFGVAKAAGRVQTTRAGQLKGKLAYMAPEQLDPASFGRDIDRRVDVYASAVVLWEALTGARLFAGETETETIHRILHGVVDPPSARAPGVEVLDAIVLRGLARDPMARFETARDMAIALEEAAPLPRAHEVGGWVEEIAAEVLGARNAKLAEIQELSTVMELPATPKSIPAAKKPTARRSRLLLGIAGLGLGAAIFFNAKRAPPPPAPPFTAGIQSAAPLAASATPPATVMVMPSSPVRIPSAIVGAPTTAPVGVPRPAPSHARSLYQADDCNPPFTMDEAGIKIPKRHCLSTR